jgi:hypothetical protein
MTTSKVEESDSRPCPSCGHCPTCGRGGYYTQPYWPSYPYSYPYGPHRFEVTSWNTSIGNSTVSST